MPCLAFSTAVTRSYVALVINIIFDVTTCLSVMNIYESEAQSVPQLLYLRVTCMLNTCRLQTTARLETKSGVPSHW